MILAKRIKPRSGILRAPVREHPRHRRFVRGFVCVCAKTHGEECSGRIEAAHWRSAANSGTGIKPGDPYLAPLCSAHHREQHQIGQPAFERKYGINLEKICRELAMHSPDPDVKAFARDAGNWRTG